MASDKRASRGQREVTLDTVSPEMVSREITYRRDRIHVRSCGAGPPIVLLRGFDVAFRDERFVEQLARRHEVIVPDHPGFGRSDTPTWLRSIGDAAYFYLDILTELSNGRPVHLVGTSLGGWLAAEIAVRDTSNIRSLIQIGPAGVRKKDTAIGDPFIRSPEVSADAMFADRDRARELRHPVDSDEQIDVHLKNNIGLTRLGWQPRLASAELQRWLHRIRVPTCLLWGSFDRIMPIEHAQVWLDSLDDARLEVIDGAGHLPHIEMPEKTAALIESFIRECPE
jgi:pimeloyl-ACP methyl ester carboxylesterase